jgi:hypothetical protein
MKPVKHLLSFLFACGLAACAATPDPFRFDPAAPPPGLADQPGRRPHHGCQHPALPGRALPGHRRWRPVEGPVDFPGARPPWRGSRVQDNMVFRTGLFVGPALQAILAVPAADVFSLDAELTLSRVK